MDVTWTAPFANGDPITAFTLYTSATWCGYLIVDVVSVPARVIICGWASGEPKAVSTVMGENTTVVLQSLSPVTSYTFPSTASHRLPSVLCLASSEAVMILLDMVEIKKNGLSY